VCPGPPSSRVAIHFKVKRVQKARNFPSKKIEIAKPCNHIQLENPNIETSSISLLL